MPRQNRVTPFSTLIVTPARGTLMGNRGCLHDANGQIVRPYRGRLWIACLPAFKARRRSLMQPGRYTELFFLDEAVALSAGHRPCAECRRADYRAFRAAWDEAGLPACRHASDIDDYLHAARLSGRAQHHHVTGAEGLPDAAFVLGADGRALLISGPFALPYTPAGYGPPVPRPTGPIIALTPAPMLAVLSSGYRARLNPSALAPTTPPLSHPDAPEPARQVFIKTGGR